MMKSIVPRQPMAHDFWTWLMRARNQQYRRRYRQEFQISVSSASDANFVRRVARRVDNLRSVGDLS